LVSGVIGEQDAIIMSAVNEIKKVLVMCTLS
jgi:hypothetical protein